MALVDEGFITYTLRGEGFSGGVDYFVTYLIVACNDNTYDAIIERVTRRKVLQSTAAFTLKVRWVNVITCTLKS